MVAQVLVVMIAAIAISIFAERRNVQPPLLLAAVGLAASFLPNLQRLEFEPEIILGLVLPPLLFSAASEFSFFSFMRRLGSIVNLGVYMVAATTFLLAVVAVHFVPGMTPEVALVLAAVIAPPDAVAAVSIGRKAGLSPGLMTVLKGESLINDAAALTLFSLTVATVVGTHHFIDGLVQNFLYAAVIGVLVGLAIGSIVHRVRLRMKNPSLSTVLTIIVPFATYLVAEQFHASGVLAVVSAGFSLGHNAAESDYAERIQERQSWRTLDTLLETFVFAYIGLQLRFVVEDVLAEGVDLWALLGMAFALLVGTIGIRFAWVFGSAAISRWRYRAIQQRITQYDAAAAKTSRPPRRSGPPMQKPFTWQENLVLSWTGMRGVVTIAAAAGIPLLTASGVPFPNRDIVIALAFLVTIGTLLLQGLTLPWLIKSLKVTDPDAEPREAAQRRRAKKLSRQATIAALNAYTESAPSPQARETAQLFADRFGNESSNAENNRLRSAPLALEISQLILAARRQRLIEARDNWEIEDAVMRETLEQLDLEQAVTTNWQNTPADEGDDADDDQILKDLRPPERRPRPKRQPRKQRKR